VQILGEKSQLKPPRSHFSGILSESVRYPRGNRAACSLGPRSRSLTSVRILRLRRASALIRINGGAVAQKHQSTGNSHRGLSDIAPSEFISYSDSPP